MGYYNEPDHYSRTKPKRYGKPSVIFISIISSVIGGMMVLYTLPFLVRSGYVSVALPNSAGSAAEVPVTSPSTVNRVQVEEKGQPQTVRVQIETDTVKAVNRVEKAVVGIINIQQMNDFWNSSSQSVESGTGSGVIFAKQNGQALIVTNYHVIKGAADVEVSLAQGSRVKGHVLGMDPLTDLAVLSIPANEVEVVAPLGSSKDLQVGEPAIAIGNPLGLHFSRTVTQGIISALDRSMPIDANEDGQPDWQLDVIQTDAAINPGNSGGALINLAGQVIGINSLKISQTGVEGLGFAIPMDDVKPIIDNLIQYGKVKRPYLGIVPRDLQEIPSYHWQETLKLPNKVSEGIVVIEVVQPGSSLKPYDVIVSLDGQPVSDSAGMRKYLFTKKSQGQKVEVGFYRNGKLMSTNFALHFE